jgi:hypothetical protein
MAFSQDDLNAISNAQAQFPNLGIPLAGIAAQETGGEANPDTATSSTGAQGLFQVLPSTAADPGFGVTPLPASELDNPSDEANFAASYLNALEQSGDTPAQAVAAYSGGGYTLAQVQSSASTVTGLPDAGTGTMLGAMQASGGGPLGGESESQIESGVTSPLQVANLAAIGSGSFAWIVELFDRAGILIIGVALAIVALVFMFKDASTMPIPIKGIGKG